MQCPIHKIKLIKNESRFGIRYSCPEDGCETEIWEQYEKDLAHLTFKQRRALAIRKSMAHQRLDTLWQSGEMTRKEAYQWLKGEMNLSGDQCHIGLFNEAQCHQVIRLALSRKNQILMARRKRNIEELIVSTKKHI
jgi:hypothetical protein